METVFGALFAIAIIAIIWKIVSYFDNLEKKQVKEIIEREIRDIEKANASADRDAMAKRVRRPTDG